jgi:hypothetical protein
MKNKDANAENCIVAEKNASVSVKVANVEEITLDFATEF